MRIAFAMSLILLLSGRTGCPRPRSIRDKIINNIVDKRIVMARAGLPAARQPRQALDGLDDP
jgi:hypothetical protein